MENTPKRLRNLRESLGLSQAKFAEIVGTAQATINRYETGYSAPPLKMLIWYADYFDVSLDFLCDRTDQPQGKLYDCKPKSLKDKELLNFVEMCFDPRSPINDRLKQSLVAMLREAEK